RRTFKPELSGQAYETASRAKKQLRVYFVATPDGRELFWEKGEAKTYLKSESNRGIFLFLPLSLLLNYLDHGARGLEVVLTDAFSQIAFKRPYPSAAVILSPVITRDERRPGFDRNRLPNAVEVR